MGRLLIRIVELLGIVLYRIVSYCIVLFAWELRGLPDIDKHEHQHEALDFYHCYRSSQLHLDLDFDIGIGIDSIDEPEIS